MVFLHKLQYKVYEVLKLKQLSARNEEGPKLENLVFRKCSQILNFCLQV